MDWRRIGRIVLWLFVFPPVGLWKLWKDPVLARPLKIRILIYSILGFVGFSVLFTVCELRAVNKMLQQTGAE